MECADGISSTSAPRAYGSRLNPERVLFVFEGVKDGGRRIVEGLPSATGKSAARLKFQEGKKGALE
jgi:hypothetical protein